MEDEMGDGRFHWPTGAFALAVFLALAGTAGANQKASAGNGAQTTPHTDFVVQIGATIRGKCGFDATAIAAANQANFDNVANAQTATPLNQNGAYTTANGSETAHVVPSGSPAITLNSVAWRLPPGYAIAANLIDGGSYAASDPHYARPFGPATTGMHAGMVMAETDIITGSAQFGGEGETGGGLTSANVATTA